MSSHTTERLIYMANQIAAAFRTNREALAVAATRDHIAKFWDPRMRTLIASHMAAGGEDLTPIARAAIASLEHDPS